MSHSLCCCCCFWLLLLWRLHSRHLAIYDAKLTAVTQDTLYTVYLHAPCTHSKQVTSTIASEVSLKRNHGHLFLRFTTDRRQVLAIEPDIQVTWRLSVRTNTLVEVPQVPEQSRRFDNERPFTETDSGLKKQHLGVLWVHPPALSRQKATARARLRCCLKLRSAMSSTSYA